VDSGLPEPYDFRQQTMKHTANSVRPGRGWFVHLVILLAAATTTAKAAVQVVIGHNDDNEATASFHFTNVHSPAKVDAGAAAKFSILTGTRDGNGGFIECLTDGQLPETADEPAANFFFTHGAEPGRLVADLGQPIEVKAVNSYSWHPGGRAPQVYRLYGSEGALSDFSPTSVRSTTLAKEGWRLVATVDTRRQFGRQGGQYGVSVADPAGSLGKFRYLLFEVAATDPQDPFGQTFFSEIDVVDANAPAVVESPADKASGVIVVSSSDGHCEITINTTRAPGLSEWARNQLAPVLAEWYPRIVAMLPGEGFVAPKRFSVDIRPGKGVAATSGARITANADWLQQELHGEALGAIIHEVVHVVQQYRDGRRGKPDAPRPPGWLVEGIPDYIRFFQFEPQSHGADLYWLDSRPNVKLNYDGSYRISANFLHYVVANHDPDQRLIARLNAACRGRSYTDELWKEWTGKTLAELNNEWQTATKQQLAALAGEGANTLSTAERAAGWELLFTGRDFTGWSNFKSSEVRPGWQVRDGALVCADPHNAGDLVTRGQFGAFELQLDYNISPGGNSGIIFHVTDAGGAVWATGPEFQLEDNAKAADPQRCGWLYALYKPPVDPRTGKPVDATLPAGQWNHVRLVVTPERCEHWINGVKYFDYVLGSPDFQRRVAASKFSKMPLFAKAGRGYLALQGDHGQVSFRNLKVRSLATKTTTH